ncbi:hypothetical protein HXX76_001157 [Chlamydomonas incerta]|uniref:Phosphodiesterase n=1 Tax=Chlamydomonas incerta TaxID=51695 RepID=A0A835WBL2_CHLIN|nr:hypothetical protein HXX76_001157 [Chlamydomonas incerta]|eukprot:KAG2444404.1 hypothetical protein HXX76_001157 [Chlamydomonas incerta]
MAKVEENSAKDRAAGLARDMATWYQVQLTGVSTGLTSIMAALVRYRPVYADVSKLFTVVGPVLLEQASSNSIKLVQISPNGWVRDTFPKNLEPTDLDLFAMSTDREAALETVRSRELTLQGPTPFVQGGYGVIVRRPIFIHGVNDTSGFGMPAPLNPYCGATCAYNPTNNTVFWGFAAVLIDLAALNSAPDSRLRMMDGLGYRYEVRALGLAAANMRQVAASSSLPGADAVEAAVLLPNNEWVVRMAPAGGWRSKYYGGLIAAVVVLAFALSLILFAALVLWRRHQMLLAVLLPRKVIQDLHKAGGAALEGTCARVVLNTDTAADVMLRVLTDVVCGEAPAISDVMLVRSAIARSADIYQPIIGITEQMHGAHMDRDVVDNLARELCPTATGFAAAALPRNVTWQRAAGPGGRLLPRCAAAPSATSADTSFRGSSLPLSYSEAAGEGPQASGGYGVGEHGHGCGGKAAAGGLRRVAGSSGALHLSDVFGTAPAPFASRDDSELIHSITGLAPAAAASSMGGHGMGPFTAGEGPAAAGGSLVDAVPSVVPVPGLGAAASAATAETAAVVLAVAAVAPAELYQSTAGGLTTTATTLPESVVSDAVVERDEAGRAAASDAGATFVSSGTGGHSASAAQQPLRLAAGLGASPAEGGGATPAAVQTAASPAGTAYAPLGRPPREQGAPGSALATDMPAGAGALDRDLMPPAAEAAAAAAAGAGVAAVDGSSSPAADVLVLPEAADKLRPLPELTRGASYRRQRTSQLTDQDSLVDDSDRDSEGNTDGEAAGAASRGLQKGTGGVGHGRQGSPNVLASGGHSGSIRHVSGPQATSSHVGNGAGSARRLRSHHSSVRVSASARARGLISYGLGPHQQHHHHHLLLQPPGSTGSSAAAAAQPKRRSGQGGLVSGTSLASAAAGEAAADSGAVAGATGGAAGAPATVVVRGTASPFLTGSATVSASANARNQQQHMAMVPPRAIMEDVERVLAGADGWQFDTFRLAEVSGGLPLSALGYFLMQRAGLIKTLGLSAKTLIRCLRVVEAGYLDNPYHSATHAADVLQTLHVIIHSAELNVHYLDPLGLFAAYWAAIVHDYRHPGLTGDFLIATSHPLAIRYNDRSPLENHHAASSFAVLRRRGMELLQPLPAEGRVAFRKQVIEMVMATDMKQHFALCSQFSTVHRLSAFSAERAKAAAPNMEPAAGPRMHAFGRGGSLRASNELQEVVVALAADPLVGVPGSKGSRMGAAPQPLDESERLLALCVAIKAADLGHLGESLEVHKRWLAGLEEEFFRQGDQEWELGMPISPLFDRAKQGVSKSQTGFYEFVGLPLVHALSSAFPGAAPLMSCFTANYQHWLRVQQEAQAQQ